MSIVYYEILFCEGKVKNIIKKDVHLTYMQLKPDMLTFTGVSEKFGNIFKDDEGFYYEIPVSDISKVYKTKARMLNYTALETYDQKLYSIIKVDLSRISLTLKNAAIEMTEALNEYLSGISFCPKCGKTVPATRTIDKCQSCSWILSSTAVKCPRCGWQKPDEYCGNCGAQL